MRKSLRVILYFFNLVMHFGLSCLEVIFKFVCLLTSALGLRCCVWAFSGCGERGCSLLVVRRLLTVLASPLAEHRL